jgi:hypothetical protein
MKVFIFIPLTGLVATIMITTTTMGTLSPHLDFKKKQGMITSTSIQTSLRRVEESLPADPGTGEFEAAENKHTRAHGSEDFSSSVNLSIENTRFLCCMIWEEIAYQTMILKAVNLDSTQKLMTLSSLLNRCLIDVDVTFTEKFALLEEPFNLEAFRNSSCAQLGYMH